MMGIIELNPFSTNVPLLYVWKNQKAGGLLMFSGGVEVERWLKMD